MKSEQKIEQIKEKLELVSKDDYMPTVMELFQDMLNKSLEKLPDTAYDMYINTDKLNKLNTSVKINWVYESSIDKFIVQAVTNHFLNKNLQLIETDNAKIVVNSIKQSIDFFNIERLIDKHFLKSISEKIIEKINAFLKTTIAKRLVLKVVKNTNFNVTMEILTSQLKNNYEIKINMPLEVFNHFLNGKSILVNTLNNDIIINKTIIEDESMFIKSITVNNDSDKSYMNNCYRILE